MSVFTKRLKQARRFKGLAQEKVGILAGIDEASASARMNQYERGVHTPDFGMVERIAGVLDVPTAFFYSKDKDEAQLLINYHRLPKADKARLLAYSQELREGDVSYK